MLIVAIPKSASTSLMSTLGSIHNTPVYQIKDKSLSIPKETPYLWQVHHDVREIVSDLVHIYADREVIYKQHIPPTFNNLALLQNTPKVILLRDPEDVILAYWRARRHLMKHNLPGMSVFYNANTWMEKAKRLGLYDDLLFFYEGWLANTDSRSLIIYYEELLEDPTKIIRSIEDFWGFSLVEKPVILKKERYTRSPAVSLERVFRQGVISLLNRMGIYESIRKKIR